MILSKGIKVKDEKANRRGVVYDISHASDDQSVVRALVHYDNYRTQGGAWVDMADLTNEGGKPFTETDYVCVCNDCKKARKAAS